MADKLDDGRNYHWRHSSEIFSIPYIPSEGMAGRL